MVRTRGRALRGQRLIRRETWGHWKTSTFAAGLGHDGLVAPYMLDGPMNGEVDQLVLVNVQLPSLPAGCGLLTRADEEQWDGHAPLVCLAGDRAGIPSGTTRPGP